MKSARKHKVLLVYFSQTGQLQRVADAFVSPLEKVDTVEVIRAALKPVHPYPFPWPFLSFFDQFPETVQLIPPSIEPLDLPANARFDLVILAYTVWFLSPSPPITAFLKSSAGRALLQDTPVITVIACRNMWLMAQEQVKSLLNEAGAHLRDNVVLTDRCDAMASFITTPRWMLTGRTDPVFGLPAPGVSAADVRGAARFGRALVAALERGELDGRRPLLQGLKAVSVDPRLIPSERIGRRSFFIWGKFVRLFGPQGSPARIPALLLYAVFLTGAICTLVPLSMLVRMLLQPLNARRVAAQAESYAQPSGSDDHRLSEFPP